ncbi:hypothetical protein [Spirosoma aerolatum]|uniref:hypothetical protein n=1 Tax=Spirosoma aerolatum TaxID=1211326 RepID=UPI0009AD0D21|nr:hypothetical protein [Spirosoma aerolatum]
MTLKEALENIGKPVWVRFDNGIDSCTLIRLDPDLDDTAIVKTDLGGQIIGAVDLDLIWIRQPTRKGW